jgi:CDP-glycerol glycerophosphotransferase (TagB/SpsB family)
LINNVRYNLVPETVKLTGLARHDLLEAKDGDYIVVSPTWRSFLTEASEELFRASEFFRNWQALIHDPRVRAALTTAGVHLKLVLHSSISQFAHCFTEDDLVKVISFNEVTSFAELLSHARMMITDYSTISFDMLYLRRPVVYYTFPELRNHSTNTNADLQLYADLGYLVKDHESAVETIVAAAGRDFRSEPAKIDAADAFFAYSDQQNSKRIIDAVLEGQTK